MKTYIINGGGQYVQQCAENGCAVNYVVKDSDYAKKSGVVGSNLYTKIWASSFDELKEMLSEWTNEDVELSESPEY